VLAFVEVVMIGIHKFRGGVHPDYSKLTASNKIKKAKLPEKVVLPLRQHVGAICDSLVKKGGHVRAGQKIADSDSPISAPIHASISGTVREISTKLTLTGEEVQSITIESDGKDKWVRTKGLHPEKSSREDILAKIRECGVVGLGGAAFPTHVKLNPPKGKKIDTVIINGAECEPYITADHRLMLEEGEKILKGTRIIARVLGVKRTVVTVEDNKRDAMENIRKLSGGEIEVVSLKTRYPQGDERHLIKAVVGREIPPGGLPFDVGVVVQNVGTAKAIYDAVYDGIPLVERVVTVTGDVKKPKNLLVRIGTSFSSLIDECGGPQGRMRKVISGGPMMGIAQSKDVPVMKCTDCILVFNESRVIEEEETSCIRCGRCIEACPMGLMPSKLFALVRNEKFKACSDYSIMSCDECGCCAYVCPSKIPLVQVIKRGKNVLSSMRK
jgi:electron transport complex protein RnfC